MVSTKRPLSDEAALRAKLGVPVDAARVLLVAESSHWDPNWLRTSEEYYANHIEPIFSAVFEELELDSRRVFSIESIFFLRMYWQRRPEERARLARLFSSGQLRLTGSAVTTPDTVLPHTEAILRDYLLGQQWLRREAGLDLHPKLAYLPDDFGASPALPEMMRALGIEHVALSRIDGQHFVGSDFRRKNAFPRIGSSAARLLRQERSLDFVWRGPGGDEVLAHWHAFTYFQGDMLAYRGVVRWMGRTFGFPWRTEGHVAQRLDSYVSVLEPVSRTPYLLCPIGCDFNPPIPRLLELLDRYNRERYPDSGTWVISAGLDDFFALLESRQDSLPTLEFDPNPYWMGFYAARPELKRLHNAAVRRLLAAEALEVKEMLAPRPVNGAANGAGERATLFRDAWEGIAFANHHDFVTGTSPDRVFEAEQAPVIQGAKTAAEELLSAWTPPRPQRPVRTFAVHQESGRVVVETDRLRMVVDGDRGGTMTELENGSGSLLSAPAFDLVLWKDWGGLWRLGHEFLGGRFERFMASASGRADVDVVRNNGRLEVRTTLTLRGALFERRYEICPDAGYVGVSVNGRPPLGTSITCAVPLNGHPESLFMDVPGGSIRRPAVKIDRPTFWPARSFVCVRAGGQTAHLVLGGPAAVGLTEPGQLEWFVGRNAPRERALAAVPVPAHPAKGTERGPSQVFAALGFGPPSRSAADWAAASRQLLTRRTTGWDLDGLFETVVDVDAKDVRVMALKPGVDGESVVVRLERAGVSRAACTVALKAGGFTAAELTDAREGSGRPLEVRDGRVHVPFSGTFATVVLRGIRKE